MADFTFSPAFIQGAQEGGGFLQKNPNDDETMKKARMEALRRMSQPQPDGRPMPGAQQQVPRIGTQDRSM